MRKAASRQGRHPDWRESAAFRQSTCEQGFRPRSLRHGGLRRPLRSTRLGTDPVEHREAILRKKRRLNALRAAFLARLSAREAFRFSGTCLRAQPQPFLRRSSHGLYFASQSCIALPCRRQLFLDLYLFFLVRLFYVCGRRTIWPRMLPPPFRAARSAYVQVPPESVWSKGKALFAGRAFFRCPVRQTKFRRSDTPEAAGNGWR